MAVPSRSEKAKSTPQAYICSAVDCLTTLEDDIMSCLAAISIFCEEGQTSRTLRGVKLARKRMESDVPAIRAKLECALYSVNGIMQENRDLQKQVMELQKELNISCQQDTGM